MQTGTATYCPEDDKLRLYVGRVPRPEYEKLRAEGWTSTPKQTCDFVAVWTPQRNATALAYGEGFIGDEDQSPEERAADRAERFGGYRDKRTEEATGHADRYDAGPQVHGFQSSARAERSAARHDRQAAYAGDAWSKAEYWTARTAGVISNALYKSTPGVRMGRIKTLEADLRRYGNSEGEWATHFRLRLAYENQMLEAQGGRAAHIEMQVGGFIGEQQIHRVNKSNVTGRVVSVHVRARKIQGWQYKMRNVPGTDYSLQQIDTERLPVNAYRPPTPEDLATLAALMKATKAAAPKIDCPLINPTDADAARLQKIWNDARPKNEPVTPRRMTQGEYSAASSGNYSSFETAVISEHGTQYNNLSFGRKSLHRHAVFKVRTAPNGSKDFYGAERVVILTDKPQKPIPWAKMETARAQEPTIESMRARMPELIKALQSGWCREEDEGYKVMADAQYIGWVFISSVSQFGFTEEGIAARKEYEAAQVPA